jgi:hypothetical protein
MVGSWHRGVGLIDPQEWGKRLDDARQRKRGVRIVTDCPAQGLRQSAVSIDLRLTRFGV